LGTGYEGSQGVGKVDPTRSPLLGRLRPATFPTAFRVVELLMGLALLVLAPKLLRGTRTSVPL
jgi:hypothetical protein